MKDEGGRMKEEGGRMREEGDRDGFRIVLICVEGVFGLRLNGCRAYNDVQSRKLPKKGC